MTDTNTPNPPPPLFLEARIGVYGNYDKPLKDEDGNSVRYESRHPKGRYYEGILAGGTPGDMAAGLREQALAAVNTQADMRAADSRITFAEYVLSVDMCSTALRDREEAPALRSLAAYWNYIHADIIAAPGRSTDPMAEILTRKLADIVVANAGHRLWGGNGDALMAAVEELEW